MDIVLSSHVHQVKSVVVVVVVVKATHVLILILSSPPGCSLFLSCPAPVIRNMSDVEEEEGEGEEEDQTTPGGLGADQASEKEKARATQTQLREWLIVGLIVVEPMIMTAHCCWGFH